MIRYCTALANSGSDATIVGKHQFKKLPEQATQPGITMEELIFPVILSRRTTFEERGMFIIKATGRLIQRQMNAKNQEPPAECAKVNTILNKHKGPISEDSRSDA